MLKDNTYVSIQSFMVNDLKLKGNELIVYAVIYGYTQDGEHWFYGTRGHLAEWCGATKGTVSNCLKSLMDKGYIIRREVEQFGIVQVQYQAVCDICHGVPKINTGGTKNCNGTISKIDTINNIDTYNRDKGRRFTPPSIEEVRAYMDSRGTPIDAESFCDYWGSIGWVRGKTKMRDWKAAARQWAKKDREWGKAVSQSVPKPFAKPDYAIDHETCPECGDALFDDGGGLFCFSCGYRKI